MGSTRLTGKVLKKIGNKTILEHIFYRLTFLKYPVKTVLATSVEQKDDTLESFCKERGIECFRGSEKNVLERYYYCAKKYKFEHVVRLTGDNPFIDIEELNNLIELHLHIQSDYTHSRDVLPLGVGAEIFTFDAIEKSYKNGTKGNHREHVNEYITDNPLLFRIARLSVATEKRRPDIRLTVDTEEDYKKACYICENAKGEFITTQEDIALSEEYIRNNFIVQNKIISQWKILNYE